MVKSPIRNTRSTAAKAAALTTRHAKNESISDLSDDLKSPQDEDIDQEFNNDSARIVQEHRQQRAKKSTLNTFQTKKVSIYAEARKSGKEITKAGVEYLEGVKAQLTDLKAQEVSCEKYITDSQPLLRAQDETFERLLELYPPMLEQLGNLRSEQINAANNMLRNNGPRRHAALQEFSRHARAHLERAKENEKIAADATALIKHYKGLLRA